MLGRHATPQDVSAVNELLAEVRRCWVAACQHDGIDPGTNAAEFMVFSQANPCLPKYNDAIERYLAYRREHRV